MTDKLTATLAEIRERSAQPLGPDVGALPVSNEAVRRLMASAADVPRLLAALEAVLALHKPGRFALLGSLCKVHESYRHFSITRTEADRVRDCQDCKAAVILTCTCGNADFEHCPTREAITRELLGEETSDG